MASPHWLTRGGKTTTPPVVISFDTETSEVDEGDHSVQRLRCWDALVRVRRERGYHEPKVRYAAGETAPGLCDLVEEVALAERETWVIAHNLSFDLAVTALPFNLVQREWGVDGLHLGDESSWWVLKKDGHKVVITDSWSWVRSSLADVAKNLTMRKVALPNAEDSLETWHRRCRHDAEILDALMLTVMDWWEENDLGQFAITGPACGWRAMKKMIPERTILVGSEPGRTDFERRAIYSGRKDVYGVGTFFSTWVGDWDFIGAYPTAAAAYPLPLAPCKPWTTDERLLDDVTPLNRDYIAEVEISTHRPCAPLRVGGDIIYPVGRFRTVLTGPEVRYCVEVADSVRVIYHRSYRMGFALADWAQWCLELINAQPGDVPDVVRRVAKGWSRSVIGRFAARTSRVIETRPATVPGWHVETGHDLDTGRELEFLSIGGVEQVIAKDLDAADISPAVLAFVEGHTRVALGRVMDAQRPEDVLQCNTDGFLLARTLRSSNFYPEGCPWPFRMSRKALSREVYVKGPNHLALPFKRRYAGIPAAAVSGPDHSLTWRDWPGLRWQLEHGKLGEYHRPDRSSVLSEHYVRRWVLSSGETIPITVEMDEENGPVVVPWSLSWGRLPGDVLAPYQVESIAAAIDTTDEQLPENRVPLPRQPGRGFQWMPTTDWHESIVRGDISLPDHNAVDPAPTLIRPN